MSIDNIKFDSRMISKYLDEMNFRDFNHMRRQVYGTFSDTIVYPKKNPWQDKSLLKIKADELDEDDNEIYVYSIVNAYFETIPTPISRELSDYKSAADTFPDWLFEEVGSNMYELIASEEELNEWAKGKTTIIRPEYVKNTN